MNPSSKPTKKEIVTEFRTREILAAARRLMQSRGVEAVTMEEIAAAAGVAKGTIYLYFQGKEVLVQALISQVGEQILAEIEAVVAAPGAPPEKIQRVASVLLDYLMRERALFPAYARDILRGVARTITGHRLPAIFPIKTGVIFIIHKSPAKRLPQYLLFNRPFPVLVMVFLFPLAIDT